MKFIKLTVHQTSKETYVNMEMVSEMRPLDDGGTKIYFNFGSEGNPEITDVKETIDQIMAVL